MNFANLCPGCMRELKSKTNSKCPHCGFDVSAYKQNTRCLPINTILAGKYLIGKVLGEGGFGITYIGFDLNMEVPVAIKEYFPVELVSRDTTGRYSNRVLSMGEKKSVTYKEGLKKYVTEAQNVSKSSNMPGVVSVKDFFYENDTAYIVMEYIDGISLKEYLNQKNKKMTESETLRLFYPLLEALEQIHASGIVHRDISPDNIMLTFKADGSEDSVKLIDFGAARMTEKNDQHSLTIILKHGYAPEEQYRTHGEQGPWTDVYAICATMYRMLTGVTPEPAMDRIFLDKLKRPSELGVGVSKAVEEALMAGLAVKKEDRIAGIAELREALGGTGKQNGSVERSWRTGFLIGIGAVLFIGMVGIGIAIRMQRILHIEQVVENSMTASNSETEMKEAETAESAQGGAVPLEQGEVQVTLEEEETQEWNVIVTAEPQYSCAGGAGHIVFRKEDGTVLSTGDNTYGQCNLKEWNRVAAVAAGDMFTAGLLENGTVIVAGELTGKDEVERWENIVQIAGSDRHLLGLTAEGKILANTYYGKKNYDFLEWENVKAITAGLFVMAALTEDGKVMVRGLQYTPADIAGWNDVTAIIADQRTVYGLKQDGTVIHQSMWKDYPYSNHMEYNGLSDFQNMVQISASISNVYGVDAEGNVHFMEKPKGMNLTSWTNLNGVVGTEREASIAAMTEEGTLLKTRRNEGSVSLEEMRDLEKITVFNIDSDSAIFGKGRDGSIVTYGTHRHMAPLEVHFLRNGGMNQIDWLSYYSESGSMKGYAWIADDGTLWIGNYQPDGDMRYRAVMSNAVDLVCSKDIYETAYCAVLASDGNVVVFSDRRGGEPPEEIAEAENWTGIQQIAGCIGHCDSGILLGLKEDGSVVSVAMSGDIHELTGDWTQIDSLYSGTYAIGAICKDGTAQFLEDAPEYNFGQYNTAGWTELKQLALGLFHTAGLREDGTVYATGRNDSGQCEVEDWTNVVYIAAGDNCTLGIQSNGTLLIAGEI